jgi:hypothetical protein
MQNDYNEYMIGSDNCPKTDVILTQDACKGCSHYKGFFLYHEQLRCIRCSYWGDTRKSVNSD